MKRGFTLIELLVVIAIIGILSSVVLASLNSARQKSRDAKRISDIKQLQLALELSFDDNSSYPAALASLVTDNYIPAIPLDPTTATTPYVYEQLTSGTDYVLRADLENASHTALDADIDGTVGTTDCADATSGFYCAQP
jgi:type II secretion system protein G